MQSPKQRDHLQSCYLDLAFLAVKYHYLLDYRFFKKLNKSYKDSINDEK